MEARDEDPAAYRVDESCASPFRNGAAGHALVDVFDVPVEFKLKERKGTLRLGDALVAAMHPFTDAAGRPTKLVDTIFTTIPGSPAYPGKTNSHRASIPQHDFVWDSRRAERDPGRLQLRGVRS